MNATPDYVSEAQDLVEAFSRGLLDMESELRERGDYDPELLNGAFRSIHTLKGLSSLAGGGAIAELSHVLETLLDELRLGKIPVEKKVLDILFESVELFGRLLSVRADPSTPAVEIEPFLQQIRRVAGQSKNGQGQQKDLSWIDGSILSVLTEYEEHRLRENLRLERNIYRIHASFDLLDIDVGIERLKEQLKAFGEVITYLPSADATTEDRLDLDILLGSSSAESDILGGITDVPVSIIRVSPDSDRSDKSDDLSTPVSTDEVNDGQAKIEPLHKSPFEPSNEDEPSAVDIGSESDVSLRSFSQTVRVDLRRLDGLMTSVGELGLVLANFSELQERMSSQEVPSDIGRAFRDEIRKMERRLNALREGILEVRMVPLGQIFDKLARVVRKLGRESGKDIRLTISGADTELDKLIVEELSDPLMHMIRNSIDHGIELPDERTRVNKSESGHIALRASQKGNRVVIEVEDDGRGMDWVEIRDTAIRRKVINREDAGELSPRQCINLIFTPGFSTRDNATELSGRGVGMDVVKTNISRLSGMIDVTTQPGNGSCFSITLPVTLALIQALVIESAGNIFCIPLNSVIESLMLQTAEISTIEGHQVVFLRDRTLPLIRLSDVFELNRGDGSTESDRHYVVVVGLAQHRVGLVVDDLLGQRDVVIKSVGKALRTVPGIAGATELGANQTVLLVDVAKLVSEAVDETYSRTKVGVEVG